MTTPERPDQPFRQLSRDRAGLGESPVWCPDRQAVWWVDVTGRRLFLTGLATAETTSWPMPEETGFVALSHGGTVVVGLETGLFRFDPDSADLTLLCPQPIAGQRFNDAATDARGRLWAATMEIDNRSPTGLLYRIEPDGTAEPVIDGLHTPNGLAVDGGRGRLYLSDSHPGRQTIWTVPLDPDTGSLGERALFVDMTGLDGRPDGAALDRDGTYWIAGVGGGCVHGFAPDGKAIARVTTPMPDPTKIAFGGPALDQAFLTSKSGPGSGGCLHVGQAEGQGTAAVPFG